MSVSLPRLAAGSVSAAVALLVLAAPAAALAAPGSDIGSDRAAQAQRSAAEAPAGAAGGAAAGRAAAADQRASASPAPQAEAARADAAQRPAAPAQARNEPQRGSSAQAGKAAGQERRNNTADKNKAADKAKVATPAAPKGKSDESAKDGDPRGNNGTFKVDGPVLDTSRGNEPHVTCAFRLSFFGYDAGQLATISFTAVAPTKGGSFTVSGTPVISTSGAKGGLYGGSYPAAGTLTAATLGFDTTQALHVKVSVASLNADGSDVPGGAKHKVFWLEPCAPAAAPAVAEVAADAVADAVVEPVMGPVAISDAPAADAATAPAAAAAAPASAVRGASLSAQSRGAATVVAAPASFGQAIVLPVGTARGSAQPATLPFTGSAPLIGMLVGSIIALAGGAALVAASRRSA